MTQKKLYEIADIIMGMRTSRYIKNEKEDTKEQKIFGRKIKTEEVAKDIDEKFYAKKGDIILSTAQPYKCQIIENEKYTDTIIPMKYAIIRIKDPEKYDISYLYYLLNSDSCKQQLQRVNEGPRPLKIVKMKDIRELEFNFPEIEKQIKYSEYLKLVDKKIELQQQVIVMNKIIKKDIINRIANKEQ